MIQYIIVLLIVAWAAWVTVRNLVGFFRPVVEGSGCAGCAGCAMKDVGKHSQVKNMSGK